MCPVKEEEGSPCLSRQNVVIADGCIRHAIKILHPKMHNSSAPVWLLSEKLLSMMWLMDMLGS